jgi:hypothetical protein
MEYVPTANHSSRDVDAANPTPSNATETAKSEVNGSLDSLNVMSFGSDFHVKTWLNTVLKQKNDVDTFASSLLTKMQLLTQDLSMAIENLSEESIKNVSRVFFDLDALKNEASQIHQNLNGVQNLFHHVEPTDESSPTSASNSFSYLLQLDKIKHRMEDSVVALKEAEHWSTLESEMDAIFASKDYSKAAQRLQEAKRSLALLENTPEYEERKNLLTKLLQQLESSVGPELSLAFANRDTASVKHLKVIFDKVGKNQDFDKFYYKTKRGDLVQLWKSFDEGMVGNHTPKRGELAQFLAGFYNQVLVLVEKEMAWISGVFPDAHHTVASLLEQILTLSPSLEYRLNVVAQSEKAACLPSIVECFQVTKDFAKELESKAGTSEEWAVPLYRGYEPFQNDYGNFEQSYLVNRVQTLLPMPEEVAEVSNVIADSLSNIFSETNLAVDRCEELTQGYASVGLVEALNGYFNAVIDRFETMVLAVRRAGLDQGATDDEWHLFQQGVKMMGTFAQFDQGLETFEQNVLKTSFGNVEKDTFPTSALSVLMRSPLNSDKLGNLKNQQVLLKLNVDGLIKTVQGLVFDAMFAPIQRHVATIPLQPWGVEGKTNAFDLPQFSLNPSSYITRIGEHLLTLPQQMELYLDDPGLEWHVSRLPYVNRDEELSPAAQYLASVCISAQDKLYHAIAAIPKLSDQGSKQVAADVAYLSNVVSALDVEVLPKLHKFKELSELPWNQFVEVSTKADGISGEDRDIFNLVAKLRQIQLST